MCGKGSPMLAGCRGYYHPGSSFLGFLFSLVLTFTLPCCSCSVAQLRHFSRPHRLQHVCGLPCPSPSSRTCSNSCPLNWWCHPTSHPLSSLFSSCFQFSPASGSFPVSRIFASGGRSIRTSASVLPVNIQGWFPLRLTRLSSLQSKVLSRVFSSTIVRKHKFFGTQPKCLYGPIRTSVHDYWKNHSFD